MSTKLVQSNTLYIAHVSNHLMDNMFHLNIPFGDYVPNIGDAVFASSDNGRNGKNRLITSILKIETFMDSDPVFNFHCVTYSMGDLD